MKPALSLIFALSAFAKAPVIPERLISNYFQAQSAVASASATLGQAQTDMKNAMNAVVNVCGSIELVTLDADNRPTCKEKVPEAKPEAKKDDSKPKSTDSTQK